EARPAWPGTQASQVGKITQWAGDHMRFESDLGQTEGGEALPTGGSVAILDEASRHALVSAGARWYALWTRSHCERLVYDQLVTRGFHPFLPTAEVWSTRAVLRHRIHTPMFPGYLFVRHFMDKT